MFIYGSTTQQTAHPFPFALLLLHLLPLPVLRVHPLQKTSPIISLPLSLPIPQTHLFRPPFLCKQHIPVRGYTDMPQEIDVGMIDRRRVGGTKP